MKNRSWLPWSAAIGLSLLAWTPPGWGASATPSVAGAILAVDKSAGTIVVGDMGPRLEDGTSAIGRRTILVTASTSFVEVKRASGPARSGWTGDYEEEPLAAWDVMPGDFVSVTVRPGSRGSEAVKVTVVDPREP